MLSMLLLLGTDIEDYIGHRDGFHAFSDEEIQEITNRIVKWYHLNRRKLPWRGDQPPYSKTAAVKTTSKRESSQVSLTNFFSPKKQKKETEKEEPKTYDFVKEGITGYTEYVSEIMLQQTRVDTVIDKYIQWMQHFPTIKSLSEATEEEVNSLWSGLGYYRRAQYLVKGARYIVEHCNGEIPTTKEELLKVPGVGEYTAGAILSIAYNKPEAAVDGNVMRVLSRLRAVYQLKSQKAFLQWCWRTAGVLVAKTDPSDYTQAIMELGAIVCTPQSPSCSTCPVREFCKGVRLEEKGRKQPDSDEWVSSDACSVCCDYPKTVKSVEIYPLAAKTKEVPVEHYAVLILESKERPGTLWLHKRNEPILTGQLEPLLARLPGETKNVIAEIQKAYPFVPMDSSIHFHSTVKHVFSHRVHVLSVCSAQVKESSIPNLSDYTWWTNTQIREAGTTSWLLLMLKTAKLTVSQFKKLPK